MSVQGGEWPVLQEDGPKHRHRSGVPYRRMASHAPVRVAEASRAQVRRGSHYAPSDWVCLADRVLSGWGPTLRLGIILVLVMAGCTMATIVALQWGAAHGVAVSAVGIGSVMIAALLLRAFRASVAAQSG